MASYVAEQGAGLIRQPAVCAGDPVLAARICAPGVPGWAVSRPRISKLVAGGARWCPLTVVTGPPGAGKTMALALWAAAEPDGVAWVTLDDYDNEPRAFWSYVVAALRRLGVAVPWPWPAASAGQAADHLFLLGLASSLADRDSPVTLVVDDLHVLTEPSVLDGLDYVLRNAGGGLRLVVSSRVDPVLPLHRYRLAGELAEIRAADLAFSTPEARLLMTQHGITLSADSLECLTRRTEGWAAGIRLAAISMDAHPDPDQFVRELAAENSAVTVYLVEEVLNAQPPEIRDMLLSTSILDRVSAEAARELTGNEQAAEILSAVARANAFVQPIGYGWYRYHTLFAEVMRLKLKHEHPDWVAPLHQRAARWHARNGPLARAVRHAAEAGDWPLAAGIVIDGLAVSDIIEPRSGQSLAGGFRKMPQSLAWIEPAPLLVCAAIALSDGQYDTSAAALAAAENILGHRPADHEAASRLAGAMIRLAAARRTGDLAAAAGAAARAQRLADTVPVDMLARHPDIRAQVLSGRGAVELWAGHLDEAARVLGSGVAAAAVSGSEHERADALGHAALTAALRGELGHADRLATQVSAPANDGARPPAEHSSAAALVALAWVHLERNELREARSRLKQAHATLGVRPDKLVNALACTVAAADALAEGRPGVAAQMVARARHGWPVPPWLDHRLTLIESRTYAAAGDGLAAVAAATRAGREVPLEAAVALAEAWVVAGDRDEARRALTPALAIRNEVPELTRLQAWLVDARLRYASGDPVRGRRSLESALRLGEQELLRLPFAMARTWLRLVLGRDPALAHAHRQLLEPGLMSSGRAPSSQAPPAHAEPAIGSQLSEREREVLRNVARMLSSAEVATEMYISVNTVKTHLKSIYRKLDAANRRDAVRRARQLELI